MPFHDEIENLVERTVKVLETNENVIKDEYTRFNTIYIGNVQKNRVNFELQITLPEIARIMNYDLEKFFQDRDYRFQKTLEYRLWHLENVPDDSAFIGIYEMDYACHSLEYSMFGIMPQWIPGAYPAYGAPIIKDKNDLDRLSIPDFFSDGFMPQLINDYHYFKENLKGRLEVGIRKSVQGPFQTATGLYGQENVFMAEITEPEFLKRLMMFVFEFHKGWVAGWEKLHQRNYGMFNIGDDDIETTSTVSPRVFRNLILPIHKQYGETFKNIHWHSCGDTNNVFQDIATIPNLKLLEMGPKDDALVAAKIFRNSEVKFYKCPDPISELDDSSPEAQVEMIENVLAAGEIVPIKILCEADSFEKGMELLETFQEVAGRK